jgi:hypothetical protein
LDTIQGSGLVENILCQKCGSNRELAQGEADSKGNCTNLHEPDGAMLSRSELRLDSETYLNSIGPDELFEKYGITAVRKIDGLDVIGVPVWSSVRPLAKRISVNAGKGFVDEQARAGAVAEAIEFCVFDQDNQHSNGQALGATFEDAYLQALLELIERDAVTIATYRWQKTGQPPPKADPDLLPKSSQRLIDKCEQADLRVLLFYCTRDIVIPVYWAILVDRYGGLENFGGWGCHLDTGQAINRAILEAIQSRAVIIAGARDDLDRRNIEFLRSIGHDELLEWYDRTDATKYDAGFICGWTAGQMLATTLAKLGTREPKAEIGLDTSRLTAVKATVSGLEGLILPGWQPGERCIASIS